MKEKDDTMITISSLLPKTEYDENNKNIISTQGRINMQILLIGENFTLCKKIKEDCVMPFVILEKLRYNYTSDIYHYDNVLYFEDLYSALKRFYEKEFDIYEFNFKKEETEEEFRNSDFYIEHFKQNF